MQSVACRPSFPSAFVPGGTQTSVGRADRRGSSNSDTSGSRGCAGDLTDQPRRQALRSAEAGKTSLPDTAGPAPLGDLREEPFVSDPGARREEGSGPSHRWIAA
jgi:hypothetical protein